jgi:hypothetical protein
VTHNIISIKFQVFILISNFCLHIQFGAVLLVFKLCLLFGTCLSSENAFDTLSDLAMSLKKKLLGMNPYNEHWADGLEHALLIITIVHELYIVASYTMYM